MAAKSPAKLVDLLAILVRHDVDFVIVGGVAGLLLGSPIPTMDLDIVHDTSSSNLENLLKALHEVHARYRDPIGHHIVHDKSKLERYRFNLLETDLGALDVLRIVGDGLQYSDLLQRTEEYEVDGFIVRALNIEALIETKEFANRPKDQNALLFLRKILQMKD